MCVFRKCLLILFILPIALAFEKGPVLARSLEEDSPMTVKVKVILKKLPLIKQERMQDFEQKVYHYIKDYKWFEDKDLPPFELNLQLVLDDIPSNVEDRYRCSILAAGSDVQYFDRRAIFPFQKGEPLEHDGQFTPLKGLLDFYIYLVIASEYDKLGYLEGTPYFDKAKAAMEQGKFSRYFLGWDRREELIDKIYGDNYKRFREMKDYYFYAMSILPDEKDKARDYVLQAVEMLDEVLTKDRDLEAAKQFIDAHYQEIIDLFKKAKNKKAIEILLKLDPDRKAIYEKYLQ
ncbi:MAG: DUF4835 family protein [Calditrichaeota bacterium]|nr:MAG: DUF4835 family protein [Calditrichota bacterium]